MPEPLVAARSPESAAIPSAAPASEPPAEGESFAEHLDEAELGAETPAVLVAEPVLTEAAIEGEADPADASLVPADDAATPLETVEPEGDAHVEAAAVPLVAAPIAVEVTVEPRPVGDAATAESGETPTTPSATSDASGDPLAFEGDLEADGAPPETGAELEVETPPSEANETPIEFEAPETPAPNVERTAVSNQTDPTAPTPTTTPAIPTTESPRVAPPAPPPPPSPAPPVLPETATAIVTERMRTMLREGGGEARLHLRPPELGAVTLSVIVEDGRVRATIDAERVDVADRLRKHGPDLRDALSEEGFSIEDVSIGAGGADERSGAWADPRAVRFWLDGLAAGASANETNDSGPTPARRMRQAGPGGIDLLA